MNIQKAVEYLKNHPYPSPLDCYEVANICYGLEPGQEGYNNLALATEAAQAITRAGWKFQGYNEYGQETYFPPETG